jgi:hypothetical protein
MVRLCTQSRFEKAQTRGKMSYRNIVKELTKFGEWQGGIESLPLSTVKNYGYESAALVQGGIGGPIVAALKL